MQHLDPCRDQMRNACRQSKSTFRFGYSQSMVFVLGHIEECQLSKGIRHEIEPPEKL